MRTRRARHDRKNRRRALSVPDNEQEFRIRPRRPPAAAESRISIPPALGRIYGYARQTARRSKRESRPARPYQQRCAVRVTYVANRAAGQWKAHGRYLSRESATQRAAQRQAGFDEATPKLDVAGCLDAWQRAGDPRLWKIIISPEFGEQLSMPQLARSVMAGIEKEIGAGVEWVAVAHYNTEHPHVHIALRGIDRKGHEIRLPRPFIQHGIRGIAEGWCTEQLGYRTKAQAMEAQRREVHESRFTSLDRIIMRAHEAGGDGSYFPVTCAGGGRAQFVVARLSVLESIGLARRMSPESWQVRRDLQAILRGMQKMTDRQRTLHAGGVLRSDERLPILPLDHRSLDCVEGRILVHGEEENGRTYLMLESTDAKVYAVYHTRRMQEMRSAGGLRVNTFIRLRRVFAVGRPRIEVQELGTAESILENCSYLRQTARRLLQNGIMPPDGGWNGWLGRYLQAIDRAAETLREEHTPSDISRG